MANAATQQTSGTTPPGPDRRVTDRRSGPDRRGLNRGGPDRRGGERRGIIDRLRTAVAPTDPAAALYSVRIPLGVLSYVLRNLATLLNTGASLTRSLSTLAQERSLRSYAALLETVRHRLESGDTFSNSLAAFPDTFDEVLVNQIKAGERAGTLAGTLDQISKQMEQRDNVRSQVLRKLSYPIVLVVAGSIAVTFLLVFVVPLFQKTYDEIGIPLPLVTRLLLAIGNLVVSYGWIALITVIAVPFVLRRLRDNPAAAVKMDQAMFRLPVFGHWLRSIAVLQFIEVFGNLIESGFTVVEALRVSIKVVRNRVMRQGIESLQAAVNRGERFSRELDRHAELFPPVVTQLIVIGEQTGNLRSVTSHIRDHLRREIDRYTATLVGTLEPVLTISLAATIAFILLAIYLPMFDMIGASRAH
jgi:type IV pilus assembly protein PilC